VGKLVVEKIQQRLGKGFLLDVVLGLEVGQAVVQKDFECRNIAQRPLSPTL